MGFKQVKEFLNEFKLKKNKEQLVPILADYLVDIEDYYFKKGHKDRETVEKLFEKMNNKKFVKCLKVLQKEEILDEGVPVIITNFIERKGSELDEELVNDYIKVVNKILKEKVKKLSEKLDIEKDIVKDILVVVPGDDYIEDRIVGIYVGRVCRKLYILAKNDLNLNIKQIKKMFKFLFKEELIYDVAVQILLEKKEYMKNFDEKQIAIWNTLTDFALKTLNNLNKDELREKIVRYCKRRSNDERDVARRVSLSQIDKDSYPTLYKVVNKLKEKNEDLAKFL